MMPLEQKNSSEIKTELQQTVVALSDALDLVGVDALYHGKRVGYMMVAGYSQMRSQLSEEQVFHLGLLHDVGVSSTEVHRHLISELEWSGAQEHCRVGAERLSRFSPLAPLAPYVLYHHTRWEDLVTQGVWDEIATLANWVFLTDRVDTLAAEHYQQNILDAKYSINKTIAKYKGSLFKPELVDLFLQLAQGDAFWLSQEPSHISDCVKERTRSQYPVFLDIEALKGLGAIFAEIVDCKSNFTYQHSLGVARLSRHLAERFGFSEQTCDKIEIAGLLHDLGKLKVLDEVLDKPSKLNEHERHQMNHHPFETFQILKKIVGFEDIARWASFHHETLDGSGYPFQLNGKQIELEARIVAVADVFQALSQERPYRRALKLDEIERILLSLAHKQKLDPDVVEYVSNHMEECHHHAMCYINM